MNRAEKQLVFHMLFWTVGLAPLFMLAKDVSVIIYTIFILLCFSLGSIVINEIYTTSERKKAQLR